MMIERRRCVLESDNQGRPDWEMRPRGITIKGDFELKNESRGREARGRRYSQSKETKEQIEGTDVRTCRMGVSGASQGHGDEELYSIAASCTYVKTKIAGPLGELFETRICFCNRRINLCSLKRVCVTRLRGGSPVGRKPRRLQKGLGRANCGLVSGQTRYTERFPPQNKGGSFATEAPV